MKHRRYRLAILLGLSAPTLLVALFMGCKAGVHGSIGGSGSGATTPVGPAGTGTGHGGGANNAGATMTTVASTSNGFMVVASSSGMDVPVNPCGTKCGPKEICGDGLDNNCDGTVDEGCPCSPGQAEPCFKGDPSYLSPSYPGCFSGTQLCTEQGTWGPCVGGAHASDNPPCFQATTNGCHAISAAPFQTVDLSTGLGSFGQGGTNDKYTLDCPMGVSPCPMPDATGHVQVIVSGQYTVTFTENVNGQQQQCQYALNVGARGLRVELSWDFPAGGTSSDFDLHIHKPGTNTAWSISGAADDCGYGNCKIDSGFATMPFTGTSAPNWFPTTQAMPGPGFPISWYKDPNMNANTCYFSPNCGGGSCQNEGMKWQSNGMGCHNPRLDIDDISCDPSATSLTDPNYCTPENSNIDFPPLNTWIRVGVHLYPGTTTYTGVDHPDVKIYCDGALAGDLGKHGFYTPETPVQFDGTVTPDATHAGVATFWPVADVMFKKDMCTTSCVVKAIYSNPATKLPLFEANQNPGDSPPFGPPYPP